MKEYLGRFFRCDINLLFNQCYSHLFSKHHSCLFKTKQKENELEEIYSSETFIILVTVVEASSKLMVEGIIILFLNNELFASIYLYGEIDSFITLH